MSLLEWVSNFASAPSAASAKETNARISACYSEYVADATADAKPGRRTNGGRKIFQVASATNPMIIQWLYEEDILGGRSGRKNTYPFSQGAFL
jgi:hypothetical protein